MSVANAWASVHALSMVMWFNHQIVVGKCLVMDTDNLKTFVQTSNAEWCLDAAHPTWNSLVLSFCLAFTCHPPISPSLAIVVGYYLNVFTLLFKPMMLRVWIMNFQIVSLIFCHAALHLLLGICLSYTFLIQVDVFWYKLLDIFRIYSCHFKWTQIHVVGLRILLSVIITLNLFLTWAKRRRGAQRMR